MLIIILLIIISPFGKIKLESSSFEYYSMKTNSIESYWTYNGTLICDALNLQTQIQTMMDSANNIWVSWRDMRQDDGDIYVQKMSGNGQAILISNGIPIVNDFNRSRCPTMVLDNEGGLIVAWHDNRTGFNEVYVQRVDAQGNFYWNSEGLNVANISSLKEIPKLTNTSDGNFVVVWEDNRTGSTDIYAQKLDLNGNKLWGENGTAICNISGDQGLDSLRKVLIPTIDGGIIVTWQDARTDAGDIYIQRLDINGVPQWTLNGMPICNESNLQGDAIIETIDEDNFTVIWADERNGGGFLERDLYIQKINSSGIHQWDVNGTVISNDLGIQLYPEQSLYNESNLYILWQNETGSDADLYFQKFNETGTKQWDNNTYVIANQTGEETDAFLTISNGDIFLTWVDKTALLNIRIYIQKYLLNGSNVWETPKMIANGSQGMAITNLIPDNDGGVVITWQDARSGDNALYMIRLNSSGGIWVPDDNGNDPPPPDLRWIIVLVITLSIAIPAAGAAVAAMVIMKKRQAPPEGQPKKLLTQKKLPEDHEKLLKMVGVFLAVIIKFKKE